MKTALMFGVACVVLVAGEKKIQTRDLPPAVQKAVEEQGKGATLAGLSREVEGGVTLYEAEFKIGNRTKDVTFDESGKIVIMEEETTLDSIPAAARGAIQKAIGKRKLVLVETVAEKGATFYEAHYKSGPFTKELKVDATGKTVK
jgi:hypothetical protein